MDGGYFKLQDEIKVAISQSFQIVIVFGGGVARPSRKEEFVVFLTEDGGENGWVNCEVKNKRRQNGRGRSIVSRFNTPYPGGRRDFILYAQSGQ
jgi:hypothetical protein